MNKNKILKLFNQGDFNQIINGALTMPTSDIQIIKVVGLSYFRLQKYTEAKIFFEKYLYLAFNSEINFYLCQCYFLLNEFKKCLNQIDYFSDKEKLFNIPIVSLKANALIKSELVKDAL